MSSAQRVDIPTGCVPNYRDFVRHLWSYEDPRLGRCLGAPPCMYRCIIEGGGGELEFAELVRAEVLVGYGLPRESIAIERCADIHLLDFASIEALHLFVVHLAGIVQHRKLARPFGDFVMWSLGFRWV